ncbi:MAG TPA: energy-coupled thiamine transporter ThiT, partial [Candidatus Atopostipes pullistercoris]|nr:energy-coupled thiamine transporter ThiT [Candidatus Atopostipes pullistercoris]
HLYAPEGMSPIIYSLIVNGSSGIATFIVTGIITALLIYRAPVLIFPKK